AGLEAWRGWPGFARPWLCFRITQTSPGEILESIPTAGKSQERACRLPLGLGAGHVAEDDLVDQLLHRREVVRVHLSVVGRREQPAGPERVRGGVAREARREVLR